MPRTIVSYEVQDGSFQGAVDVDYDLLAEGSSILDLFKRIERLHEQYQAAPLPALPMTITIRVED
jgi:hypothetical protein